MANFFRPLLTGGVNLTKSMCDTARTAGHRIVTVVASGGVVGNDSFVEEFFKQLRSETDIQTFEKVQE